MFKIVNKIKIFVITILVGMVFAVNVGYTFASDNASKVSYKKEVSSSTTELGDSSTYLNDVVVNNSTIQIPIGYALGTVQRDINFDYSFSEPTDVAITYQLSYVNDTTEPSNVILNVVNREEYIWDQETVLMENYTNAYDASSSSGTLYYLNSLSGVGNQKLFSGVTFLNGNNQIDSYVATSDVVIGLSQYTVDDRLTAVDYQYTQLEIARYWDVYTTNSINQPINYICKTSYTMGGVTVPAGVIMSSANYDSYIDSGAGVYSVTYVVSTAFSSYSIGDTLTADVVSNLTLEERANVNISCTKTSSYWALRYECVTEYTTSGGTTYTVGSLISAGEYQNLVAADASCVTSFQTCYLCLTSYSIQAQEKIITTNANITSNTIPKDTVISDDEYRLLFSKEQRNFETEEYKTFENKNLQIDVKVYTKLAAKAQASEESGSDYATRLADYYDEDTHYFKNFKCSSEGKAFSYWAQYKSGSLTGNSFMIYNSHVKYENGIPYATNFSYGKNLSTVEASAKSNLVSSYIYKEGTNENDDPTLYFYSYAGGNKYNAGVGVYYLTRAKVQLTVRVSISWYNSNGVKISSMPINNVRLKYSGTDGVEFTKIIDAGYGYFDILEYVQTTTEGILFDMTGYSLVISSVAVIATETASAVSSDFKDVKILNSTSYNPILYSYNYDLGSSSVKPLNITISNNTGNPIKIPSVVLSPSFVAYNGSNVVSSAGGSYVYGEAKKVTPNFGTTSLSVGSSSLTQPHFTYNSNLWTCSADYANNKYTFSSTGYLAPHTSITVISGIVTPSAKDGNGNTNIDWGIPASAINQTSGSYYADYWFEVDASLSSNTVTSETTFASSTGYGSAEIITYLNNTKITTTEKTYAYIGLRNNTLQKITSITYTGRMQKNNNSGDTVTYGVSSYLSENATKTNNTFAISSTSVELMPGESIIICKLEIGSGQANVYLAESTVQCTLEAGQASNSGVYFKRDYASGNLSIVNLGADTKLKTTITSEDENFSNKNLVEGTTKWNSEFVYIMQDANNSLATFRQNQMINLLKDYYTKIESTGWSVPAN